MKRLLLGILVVLISAGLAEDLRADWLLTSTPSGPIPVTMGQTFSVDFAMVGSGTMDGADLFVEFSEPGLTFNSATWSSSINSYPYSIYLDYTGGTIPWSSNGDRAEGYTFQTVNGKVQRLEVSNFAMSGAFTLPGTFVTLSLTVSPSFSGSSVTITPLAGDTESSFTQNGESVHVITNVPEPSTWAMMITGGAAALGSVVVRRRRQQQAEVAKAE